MVRKIEYINGIAVYPVLDKTINENLHPCDMCCIEGYCNSHNHCKDRKVHFIKAKTNIQEKEKR